MNLSDIAVYIPAFNAENTLPRVFSLLPKVLRDEAGMVLVVDKNDVLEVKKEAEDCSTRVTACKNCTCKKSTYISN